MHDNFIALNRVKRDRIINAALGEFSSKGYKNASTNEIVKKAGISKGALFHYFKSKRDLFEFLYRYSIDFFMKALWSYGENIPSDVFERWKLIAVLKVKIAALHPEIVVFMQNAAMDRDETVQAVLKGEYRQLADHFSKKLYSGIDYSRFRSGIDTSRALQIIWWTLEGIAATQKPEPFDLAVIRDDAVVANIIREVEAYLDLLKKFFYREEYL